METKTTQSNITSVESQLLERRANFGLSLSTPVTIITIIMAIGLVGMWLFMRQYTQLAVLGGSTILLLVGSVLFPVLHRQGRTTLGSYVLLISFTLVLLNSALILPDLLSAASVGFIVAITLAILLLGDHMSRWYIICQIPTFVAVRDFSWRSDCPHGCSRAR
jgi:hypothetical protein